MSQNGNIHQWKFQLCANLAPKKVLRVVFTKLNLNEKLLNKTKTLKEVKKTYGNPKLFLNMAYLEWSLKFNIVAITMTKVIYVACIITQIMHH